MPPISQRVLGIDYGTNRIGIALSDPLNVIARGIATIPNDAGVFAKLKQIVDMHDVRLVVVGMPYTLGGEKGEKAREVDSFVEKLKQIIKVNVETWDERFTSAIAQQTMKMMGTTKKQRRQKEKVDEMASALILQSYLDRRK